MQILAALSRNASCRKSDLIMVVEVFLLYEKGREPAAMGSLPPRGGGQQLLRCPWALRPSVRMPDGNGSYWVIISPMVRVCSISSSFRVLV